MLVCLLFADMVELADTPDLGSGAVRHTGSSPAIRTTPAVSKLRTAGFLYLKLFRPHL